MHGGSIASRGRIPPLNAQPRPRRGRCAAAQAADGTFFQLEPSEREKFSPEAPIPPKPFRSTPEYPEGPNECPLRSQSHAGVPQLSADCGAAMPAPPGRQLARAQEAPPTPHSKPQRPPVLEY